MLSSLQHAAVQWRPPDSSGSPARPVWPGLPAPHLLPTLLVHGQSDYTLPLLLLLSVAVLLMPACLIWYFTL